MLSSPNFPSTFPSQRLPNWAWNPHPCSYSERAPRSSAKFSQFRGSFHAWTAETEWADFPRACIYCVVGPGLRGCFASLLCGRLTRCFTRLVGEYDEDGFLDFLLDGLSLLHLKIFKLLYQIIMLTQIHSFIIKLFWLGRQCISEGKVFSWLLLVLVFERDLWTSFRIVCF